MSVERPDPEYPCAAATRRAVVALVTALALHAPTSPAVAGSRAVGAADASALAEAQRSFYNGDYDRAASAAQTLCAASPDQLDACELRTASLLFQVKKALADTGERDKSAAWVRCGTCPATVSSFLTDIGHSRAVARARLRADPSEEEALFFLGKIDLNYVWLQVGTLGRRTGWDEYWEARRSLDRVLRINPDHARARVARAWVDYIVGSTVPRGARWLLGGGNKKRGLLAVRDVVEDGTGEFFDQAEAQFALWDMQVRERELAGAVETARRLARDFPANPELRRFLAAHVQ